jgi:hypothetical protein
MHTEAIELNLFTMAAFMISACLGQLTSASTRARARNNAVLWNSIDCGQVVAPPVDAAPIRSPQAVHTAMLRHIAGKDLVEIGTRNGDGMACFSRAAKSATAVELSVPYCNHLRKRAAALKRSVGVSWTVLCEDYRSVRTGTIDASVFTWWQVCANGHPSATSARTHA